MTKPRNKPASPTTTASTAAESTPAPPRGKRRRPHPLVDRSPVTISYGEFLNNLDTAEAIKAERQRKRKGKSMGTNFAALSKATDSPFPKTDDPFNKPPKMTDAERAVFRDSYHVKDSTPSTFDLRRDFQTSIQLRVDEIQPYDHNPRLYANERADDIRTSILANGFNGLLTVTKRSKDSKTYMLAAGSNTTLAVLQELYASTGEERYLWINCLYQPFESEGRLLAQHLGENLNRGDMKFWEVAKGMCELMRLIEEERQAEDPQAKPLSVRDMAAELMARGLKADKSSISNWRFASEQLGPLGNWAALLTSHHLKFHFAPRLNALRDLAKRFEIPEEHYWQHIVSPCLKAYADTFPSADPIQAGDADSEQEGPKLDAEAVCDLVEAAFARHVGEARASVTQMLQLLKVNGRITLAELRTPSPNLIAAAAKSKRSRVGSGAHTDEVSDTETTNQVAGNPNPVRQGEIVSPSEPDDAAPTYAPTATAFGQTQRPLNLLSSLNTVAPAAPALAAHTPSAPRQPHDGQVGAPRSAVGPLFETPASDIGGPGGGDPLQQLHTALADLLEVAQLQDTLRWKDDMPLGFYVELPDPVIHALQDVPLRSPAYAMRQIKTAIWWQLAAMAGQLCIGAEQYLDKHSRVYAYQADQISSPMTGTDIDTMGYYGDELTLYRITPGLPANAMRALRRVEECATQVYESMPERWKLMQRFAASEADEGAQYSAYLFADVVDHTEGTP